MALLTTALLSIALVAPQEVKTKTYQDKEADIVFDYPETWKLDRQRYANVLQFSIGNEQILVRLLKTDQRYPAEHWQSSVKMVEETNGNEVLRQWEEELLGVPLLMTRYREQQGAVRSIVLVGLLYAKTPEKLSFRVIAPEPVADQAEEAWRNVLLTSRTVSGNLPVREEPGSTDPVEVTPPVKEDPGKTIRLEPKTVEAKDLYKGPVRVQADAGRGIYAYLPEGWSYADKKLTHAESGLVVGLTVGVGDAESAKRVWLQDCGKAMSEFSKIGKRLEPKPTVNKAGFTVRPMVRTGSKDEVEMVQYIALGWTAGLSWTTTYMGSQEDWNKNQGVVMALLDRLSVASS